MLERKSEIKGTKGMKVKKRSEKWYWEDFKVYVPLCGKTANNQKLLHIMFFHETKKTSTGIIKNTYSKINEALS